MSDDVPATVDAQLQLPFYCGFRWISANWASAFSEFTLIRRVVEPASGEGFVELVKHMTRRSFLLHFQIETERKSRHGRKAVDLLAPPFTGWSVPALGFRFLFARFPTAHSAHIQPAIL
jgi:hypothetical protein